MTKPFIDIRCPKCGKMCFAPDETNSYKWCHTMTCDVAIVYRDGSYKLRELEEWEVLDDEEKVLREEEFQDWLRS